MQVTMSNYLSKQKEVLKNLVKNLSTDHKYVSVLAVDTLGKTYSAQNR